MHDGHHRMIRGFSPCRIGQWWHIHSNTAHILQFSFLRILLLILLSDALLCILQISALLHFLQMLRNTLMKMFRSLFPIGPPITFQTVRQGVLGNEKPSARLMGDSFNDVIFWILIRILVS